MTEPAHRLWFGSNDSTITYLMIVFVMSMTMLIIFTIAMWLMGTDMTNDSNIVCYPAIKVCINN